MSVIVPFAGDADDARDLLTGLARLELLPGDEILIGDNAPGGAVGSLPLPPKTRAVIAAAEASSYHARNAAAAEACGDWLLFTDADCKPLPDLLNSFFSEPIANDVGAVGGAVVPEETPAEGTLAARWAASREILNQQRSLLGPGPPALATANLLVRRKAYDSVGGFLEGVRSGADFEFCWRLADAGWKLDYVRDAAVEHRHRESVSAIARQMRRYGAGNAWQERRRPGSSPSPPLLRDLGRSVAGAIGFTLSGQLERGRMKVIDGIAVSSRSLGRFRTNRAERWVDAEGGGPALLIASDQFPALSENFIRGDFEAISGVGRSVRVEAIARPARPRVRATWDVDVRYLEDEGPLERLSSMAWLAVRHPWRCLADVSLRRRFSREERMPLRALAPFTRRLLERGETHVHVHFAALAAVNALRSGRIAGVSVSLAPHAHEIYVTPRRLDSKLELAAFTLTDCEYTADHLRSLVNPSARSKIRKLPLGVDTDAWARAGTFPDSRKVVAIGRLVEKKGFSHLVEAAALLEAEGEAPDQVVIIGDGPLRDELAKLIDARGLEHRVTLAGSLEPDRVGAELEQAAVVCIPCVVAANGDRDALPVVTYEALAMGVPVVATDLVGLPEVVMEPWGRLARPGDPQDLADQLGELLQLTPEDREQAGAAGRAHVLEHASQEKTRALLLRTIDGTTG